MIVPARPISCLRGRCPVFGPLLAILWLAVMTSGCSAAPPSQRSLIFDPSAAPAARPGFFFALLEEKILTDQVATAVTDAFGGADSYERVWQELRGMSSDALARDYMAGFDGYLTGLIALRLFNQLNLPPDAAKNVFHMPDGSTDVVPAPRALQLSLGSMRIAAEILRGRKPPVQIARTYMASVEGDCPFPAGGIELAQRGFLVEGVRNGRLLLAGAVGETQATFLALEARYATVTTPEEGPLDIDAPDRPSELYQAALGTPRLTLSGLTFKSCRMVLTPVRGAANAEEIIEQVTLSNGKTYEVKTERGMPIPFKDRRIELQQLGPVFRGSPAEHVWSLQAQLHQKGNFLVTVTTPMDDSSVERFECVGPGQILQFFFQGDRYPEMWRWVFTPSTSWIPFEFTFQDKVSHHGFTITQWTRFDQNPKANIQRYWDRRTKE
jgi:hypothetical protein